MAAAGQPGQQAEDREDGGGHGCAVAALPERAQASRRVALRADAGYFAGALARAACSPTFSPAAGPARPGLTPNLPGTRSGHG